MYPCLAACTCTTVACISAYLMLLFAVYICMYTVGWKDLGPHLVKLGAPQAQAQSAAYSLKKVAVERLMRTSPP